MPVKGLHTFSENTPGILVDINLKELIKQELSSTGDRPTIVIDGSVLPFLFNSKESLYIFGQPAVIKMKIESFFEEIISSGANVIVVLRGGVDVHCTEDWFFREKNTLLFERKKCETLKEAGDIYYYFVNSATHFCCNETLASISNEHYTALTSLKLTANETAKIAVKEKCLALLGQDSNYLIYEGIRFYILLLSLNLETFSCKFHDRNELLKCLGLKSYQLPMFATLCGNEIVPHYLVGSFHKRISGGKSPVLFVAEKIKNTSSDPYGCVKEIVNLIAHKRVAEDIIKKSLDMYLKFEEEIQPDTELLKFALERIRKCDWNHKLYRILTRSEYYSKRLTDICNVGLATFELLRPLRKKLYGILLPSDDSCVKEYFLEEMLLHNYERTIPKTVCKIPNPENPGLIELFGNRTPEINFSRWKLFLSCVSETLSVPEVRIVPENCLIPVMALHYLHVTVRSYFQEKKVFKQEFEVEAFLLGVLLFEEFPREGLEDTDESEPDPWELQLHILYLDVCFILHLLNKACGFVISRPKACCCSFYDGKLTHWIYNNMRRGAKCDEFLQNNMVLRDLFYTLMNVIKTE